MIKSLPRSKLTNEEKLQFLMINDSTCVFQNCARWSYLHSCSNYLYAQDKYKNDYSTLQNKEELNNLEWFALDLPLNGVIVIHIPLGNHIDTMAASS